MTHVFKSFDSYMNMMSVIGQRYQNNFFNSHARNIFFAEVFFSSFFVINHVHYKRSGD